ncbi:Golgi SNAP receptor complex member 1 [Choanephora cucurbitarum]|uniref:Golgi SNAP receptor complex member 1 n=1 Tax=Choanephora cucurbitarum TaxID=101091 RepID=A0A1C7NIQ8_9FUNG|nr:Golgi SNAP receptor complex member 1 [Choanephora cucurbitarum]
MQRTPSPSQKRTEEVSWDQLRKEARSLESEIELKLATLTKIGQSTGLDHTGQEKETDDLLKKLQSVITEMGDFIDRPSPTPTNPSMIHMLSRHKDILYDYTKEFRRVKSNIKLARDKADLMNQVQDEIRTFNSNNRDNADYYLTERNRIESSHRMTDMVLEQAYATRQDISRQGQMMQSVNQRVGTIVNRIPGINNIITRINTRRKRDTLIMAGVVSTCSILIILYWLRT